MENELLASNMQYKKLDDLGDSDDMGELGDFVATPWRTYFKPNHYPIGICHLYRGELQNCLKQQQRVDQAVNWSVTISASLILFSFHEVVPVWFHSFILLVVCLFSILEQRRFQKFLSAKRIVRTFQKGFFMNLIGVHDDSGWVAEIAMAYRMRRHNKIGNFDAWLMRMRKNGFLVGSLVMLGWAVKISTVWQSIVWTEPASLVFLGFCISWPLFGIFLYRSSPKEFIPHLIAREKKRREKARKKAEKERDRS